MVRRKSKKREHKEGWLGFIPDIVLRKDIRNALDFSVYLIDASAEAKSRVRKKELRRSALLYVASIVEALCLFVIKKENLLLEKVDLKSAQAITLPQGATMPQGMSLVIAFQEKTIQPLQKFPFNNAINLLQQSTLISSAFAKKIHELKERRNSQHLYGRTSGRQVPLAYTQHAFSVLTKLLRVIQKKYQ